MTSLRELETYRGFEDIEDVVTTPERELPETPLEVHTTTDLDQFSYSVEQRPLNLYRMEALANAMEERNLLRNFPIVVTEEMVVRDGQHRLEAARLVATRTGQPVTMYYLLGDMTIEDVASAAGHVHWWSVDDYLHSFCQQGYEEYLTLRSFLDRHVMNTKMAIDLIGPRIARHALRELFISGRFTADNIEVGERIMQHVADFDPYIHWNRHNYFVRAIRHLIGKPDYDPIRMMRKVDYQAHKLQRRVSMREQVEVLCDIYNFKRGVNEEHFHGWP